MLLTMVRSISGHKKRWNFKLRRKNSKPILGENPFAADVTYLPESPVPAGLASELR